MATVTASQACYRCTVASWRKRHPEKLLGDLRGLAMYNPIMGSTFFCDGVQEHPDPNTGESFLLVGTRVKLTDDGQDCTPTKDEGHGVTVAWFNSETTYLIFGWPDPEPTSFDPEND